MIKLLTTIALLCFSIAANAEVWFCTSEFRGLTMPVTASGFANKDAVFIADTDRGLRWEDSQIYIGECVITSPFDNIDCKASPFIGRGNLLEYRLFIHETTGMFTAVKHELEQVRINTYAGTCTKA
jgi:hypothetical protein